MNVLNNIFSAPSQPGSHLFLFHLEYANTFILDRIFTKMAAYLLIYGDMYWITTFSFLEFITDNVMLDFKCTLVWNNDFL